MLRKNRGRETVTFVFPLFLLLLLCIIYCF